MKHLQLRPVRSALALSLGIALSGCIGGMPTNRSLESVHQPVIERTNYTLDVTAGPSGLSLPEQRRLTNWLAAMKLHYGDRVTIDDPLKGEVTRSDIATLVAKHGILMGSEAPVTPGYVNAGSVRVVITRSTATVPGCPDWSAKADGNFNWSSGSNYGCATNANMAAMVADPEHLLKGAETGSDTMFTSSTRAIDAYSNGTAGKTSGGASSGSAITGASSSIRN